MSGVLLRNFPLYARNLHQFCTPKSLSVISRYTDPYGSKCITGHALLSNRFPSKFRLFSSEDGSSNLDSKPESETSIDQAEDRETIAAEVEVTENKDLKVQIDDYFKNKNDETLPSIFESILKRRVSGKHEDTDDELLDDLQLKPIDGAPETVSDEEIESDFDELYSTDEEIENLYNARDISVKRIKNTPVKMEDPDWGRAVKKISENSHFNMDDRKWDDYIAQNIKDGNLDDMRECEDVLEDMLRWDKLLPDEVKLKVEMKFNEIGDRVEKGELEVEEGYALFKEFEDQMVLECAKLMEDSEGLPQSDEDVVPDNKKDVDDPPGEGPILRWQTRVVFAPGGDAWHPKNRKVKLAVTVKELGLSKLQYLRLRELVGKRYNPGKDQLTITSERFEHREENRKDCLRTLFALIEEAGKARKWVEAVRVSDVKERLKANPKFMERLQAKKESNSLTG